MTNLVGRSLGASLRSLAGPLTSHRAISSLRSDASRCHGARHRWQTLPVAQAADDPGPGSSRRRRADSGAGGGLDPALERAVPPEQRPVNELKQLRQTSLYSWVRQCAFRRCSDALCAWQNAKCISCRLPCVHTISKLHHQPPWPSLK